MYGESYTENPRFLLTEADFEMVRLWRLFRSGWGAGYLPDPGGVLDQPNAMLDAFALMSEAEATLEEQEKKR